MKINNINCCKPRKQNTLNFAGEISQRSHKRVLCKHFYEMNNDDLAAVSIARAHKQVEKSNKMRLYKAIPTITTAVIGTSFAIAQPGKLATKLATGLGFLVAGKIMNSSVNSTFNAINKKEEITQKKVSDSAKIAAGVIKGATCLAACLAGAKGIQKATEKFIPKVSEFIAKEAQTLSKEINSTNLAKLNDRINPFIAKHSKAFEVGASVASLVVITTASVAEKHLSKKISQDVKELAQFNFIKGKAIQKVARAHFDSVEAVEV